MRNGEWVLAALCLASGCAVGEGDVDAGDAGEAAPAPEAPSIAFDDGAVPPPDGEAPADETPDPWAPELPSVAPDLGTSEAEKGRDCDRSAYNCKVPDRPNEPNDDRNRAYNRATRSTWWPVRPGAALLDGLGNSRGGLRDDRVRVNYGMRKPIHGRNHVYAWDVGLDTGGRASGWVDEGWLVHGPIRMPTLLLPNPGQGEYEARWVATGGDPAAFGDLKVNAGFDGGGRAATDYLARPGGYVNLLYALPLSGGLSIDTYPIGVEFRRARGVRQLDIALYPPGSHTATRRMAFIYGHIDGRYGWIARDALALAQDAPPPPEPEPVEEQPPPPPPPPPPPDPAPPPPVNQCYVRCCDDSLTGPLNVPSPAACHDASQAICEGRGHVRRSEFNGGQVYERDRNCYALCRNRQAFHRVEGVHEDCTGRARDFCAQNDRGGLRDAVWSQCDP